MSATHPVLQRAILGVGLQSGFKLSDSCDLSLQPRVQNMVDRICELAHTDRVARGVPTRARQPRTTRESFVLWVYTIPLISGDTNTSSATCKGNV